MAGQAGCPSRDFLASSYRYSIMVDAIAQHHKQRRVESV